MDPLLSLISLLRPRATLWHQIDAAGPWALSFRRREDLLFCWVWQGQCELLQPDRPVLRLLEGDFVLVRTCVPFRLASDAGARAVPSERVFAQASRGTHLRLGEGGARPARLRGGRIVFDPANANLLVGLLPPLIHLSAAGPTMEQVRALLQMNLAESREPGPGSDFVVARLLELLLVHLLRHQLPAEGQAGGLLSGLRDPAVAVALRCIHGNIAHRWTVAELAKRAGVSRSGLAERFRRTVGTGPMDYLLQWRMAQAKDRLRGGAQPVSKIAFTIGFQSASAFSTAFRRTVGCSPKQYGASTRTV